MDNKIIEQTEPQWAPLYKAAGIAAILTLVFLPFQILVFIAFPPPGFQPTSEIVTGWYHLFNNNPVIGLIDLDLFMLIDYVLSLVITTALYVALKRIHPSFMAMALVLGLVQAGIYLTCNPAFTMLNLSSNYATAATELQKTQLVTAGQVIMATYQGTPFNVSYVMAAIGGLLTVSVMLRCRIFSKTTGIIGLIMNILMLVPPTVGQIGFFLSFLSLVPMVFWLSLIARRFFQLSRETIPVS